MTTQAREEGIIITLQTPLTLASNETTFSTASSLLVLSLVNLVHCDIVTSRSIGTSARLRERFLGRILNHYYLDINPLDAVRRPLTDEINRRIKYSDRQSTRPHPPFLSPSFARDIVNNPQRADTSNSDLESPRMV